MNGIEQRTLVLSAADVQEVVGSKGLNTFMDELIVRLEQAISSYSPENTDIPARSGFSYEQPTSGLIEWMPVYENGKDVVLKLVGYHPSNPEVLGFPTILSSIFTFDTKSGHLESIVDGVLLTALRTGAASAVASRFLAKQDSETLGLLGCGVQGVTQFHALSRIFDIKTVLVFDTDPRALDSFEERVSVFEHGARIKRASIEEIVQSSDIISSATSIDIGAGPLFGDIKCLPHLHINAVGSDFPGKTELPIEYLRRSLVCPDFYDQAVKEGECQKLDPEEIGPSLSEIASSASAFESHQERMTVFDSTGWALEDRVAAQFALDSARQLGIGEMMAIESMPIDCKNPYEFISGNVQHLNDVDELESFAEVLG